MTMGFWTIALQPGLLIIQGWETLDAWTYVTVCGRWADSGKQERVEVPRDDFLRGVEWREFNLIETPKVPSQGPYR